MNLVVMLQNYAPLAEIERGIKTACVKLILIQIAVWRWQALSACTRHKRQNLICVNL